MKKGIINNIINIAIVIIASVLVYLIIEKTIFEPKNDELELKNEQIKNLESKIKYLEDLNSIYKKDTVKTSTKEDIKTITTGVSMGGKSISIEELIDYANKFKKQSDDYKVKYELLSNNYGLLVAEKDGYYITEEKRNGKVFMLNKEIYIQKTIIDTFQKYYKKRFEYNINDSIVTLKTVPFNK